MLCQAHPVRAGFQVQFFYLHEIASHSFAPAIQLFSDDHFSMTDNLVIKIIPFYNFIQDFSF